MILEQLAKICHEIRMLHENYRMSKYLNIEDELTARLIADKQEKEDMLARQLYAWVKTYALENQSER